jgi:hypothetical protein
MDFTDLVDKAGAIVAAAALVGIVLVLPLYVSQRRDLVRLRAWMERQHGHPAADFAASEAILDRAETQLEELLGEAPAEAAPAEVAQATPAEPVPPTPAGGTTPVPAAYRVRGERPALERITMERAALEPHPRWRRFLARFNQPRLLIGIAIVALALGVAALFGSEKLLESEQGGREPKAGAVDPADVLVTVLNGAPSVPGLAAKVGDDVDSNGFDLGQLSATQGKVYGQTVVMYSAGEKPAARLLARDLGVTAVQRLDRQTKRLSEGADVVVIAGEDRAK